MLLKGTVSCHGKAFYSSVVLVTMEFDDDDFIPKNLALTGSTQLYCLTLSLPRMQIVKPKVKTNLKISFCKKKNVK